MAVGRIGRPVLLKRGLSGTIEEWLMAAEYVMSSGNPNVILCERGIRTFETAYRNTLDVTSVPLDPPADPPARLDRPVACRREALARLAAGPRGNRGRRRRPAHRGPPAPRRGTLRRRAVRHAEPVRRSRRRRPRRPRAGPRASMPRAGRRWSTPRAPDAPGVSAVQAPAAVAVRPAARLRGEVRPPGDKSVSHRALLLALLAEGESRISGAGDGADVRATAGVVAALGATVGRSGDDPRAVDYRVASPGRSACASQPASSTARTPARRSG